MFDLRGQMLSFVVKLAQFRVPNLVDPLHLTNHEFGVADNFQGRNVVRNRIPQSGEKPVVLGVIISVVAEVLAEFGNFLALRIVDDESVAGRSGIAAGSSVDVGGVSGGRGLRRGEKALGIRRT